MYFRSDDNTYSKQIIDSVPGNVRGVDDVTVYSGDVNMSVIGDGLYNRGIMVYADSENVPVVVYVAGGSVGMAGRSVGGEPNTYTRLERCKQEVNSALGAAGYSAKQITRVFGSGNTIGFGVLAEKTSGSQRLSAVFAVVSSGLSAVSTSYSNANYPLSPAQIDVVGPIDGLPNIAILCRNGKTVMEKAVTFSGGSLAFDTPSTSYVPDWLKSTTESELNQSAYERGWISTVSEPWFIPRVYGTHKGIVVLGNTMRPIPGTIGGATVSYQRGNNIGGEAGSRGVGGIDGDAELYYGMVCAGNMWVGSPDMGTWSDSDGGPGVCVMYYDEDDKFVRLRPAGRAFEKSEEPDYAESGWPNAVMEFGGLLEGGKVRVGVSFYSSVTGRRSPVYLITEVEVPGGQSVRSYIVAQISVHRKLWDEDNFDFVEFWRTPSVENPDAVLMYLEGRKEIGDTPSSFDTNGRTEKEIVWGYGRDLPSSPSELENWKVNGLKDSELLMAEPYDAVWSYMGPPPVTTTKLELKNQVCFVNDGLAEQQAITSSMTVYPHQAASCWVKWSSLGNPNPENFSDYENNWRPDTTVGDCYGFVEAGDSILSLGTKGITAIRRMGNRVLFSEVAGGAAPVCYGSWASVGDAAFVMTNRGLLGISPGQGAVLPDQRCDYWIMGPGGWMEEVREASRNFPPPILVAYDPQADALYVANTERGSAFVLWNRTGQVTRMEGFWWTLRTEGLMPMPVMVSTNTSGMYKGIGTSRKMIVAQERFLDNDNHPEIDFWTPAFGDALSGPVLVTAVTRSPGAPFSMRGSALLVTTGSVQKQLCVNTVSSVSTTSQQIVFAVSGLDGFSTQSKASIIRKLTGAEVYVIGEGGYDRFSVKRAQISTVSANSIALTVDEEVAEDLAGRKMLIGPIVMRFVTPPLRTAYGGREKNQVGVMSANARVDLLDVMKVLSGSSFSYDPSMWTDAVEIVCEVWRIGAGELGEPGRYGRDSDRELPGCMKVFSESVPFSEKAWEAATELKGTGNDLFVVLEILAAGAQPALYGWRIIGDLFGSPKRAVL